MASAFLPVLSSHDIDQAAQLIQQAYAPQAHLSSEDQRRLQQELFDIQKRPQAWGLVLPFLSHSDPNVQFFGAHTIQVKIARDWAEFPSENAFELRDLLIDLTGRSMSTGHSKVILRKLFVAITSLALKLCPQTESEWPNWLTSCVQCLSALGAATEHLMDFLAIAAEEIVSADLLSAQKSKMEKTLLEAAPMVMQAVTACISRPRPHPSQNELRSALKCFEAWLFILPSNNLTAIVPLLINLLTPISGPADFDEEEFELAAEALEEIMSRSALAGGTGTKTLTEPLLLWFERHGGTIVENTLKEGFADSVSRSLCKLLTALGDHSPEYLAANLASSVSPSPVLQEPISTPLPPKSHLIQTFLRLLLAFTALPGYYGVDEEESEMTLGFWYLFQEALWSTDPEYNEDDEAPPRAQGEQGNISRAVYSELVQALRRKVVWPEKNILQPWARDQRDKFQAYRRDVGDTLVNAYYILRDDMLAYYVSELIERISSHREGQGWEEVEGTLHCIVAIQEAIPLEDNPHLARIFGPEILGRLPTSGCERVRRTAIILIGEYASWFTTQPSHASGSLSSLMTTISYIVSALSDPDLCLHAANSLRSVCDANRTALAPHISAFGELHAGLVGINDTEKSKVLQSIASVIQALPPEEEIPPVEAIVSPVVSKLYELLQSPAQLPEETRALVVQQLQTIAGVARGLTRTNDSLLIFDDSPDMKQETERMRRARQDPRVARLRDAILDATRRTVDLWCTDASVSDALSELCKAITSLPSDDTLLSLPAGPLLELICLASQRQLTAVWLNLATMLIIQMDPPALFPTTFKSVPSSEARGTVLNAVTALLQSSLNMFGQPGAMVDNPDIVQAFFISMETVAQHFTTIFYDIPPELFGALLQCAIGSLSLQERYSLVSACTFLASLVNRTATNDQLGDAKAVFVQTHGRNIMYGLLSGLAGVAPRSAMVNLTELLSTLVNRFPLESKAWMSEILYSPDFVPSKATNETKEKFLKTIFNSRSSKRIREAAQQFTLVSRGLEGSSFGYATVTM